MNKNIEELTKQLVSKITQFKLSDPNFKISHNFAISNFQYHKFLDVNEKKVVNAIEGLSTKFYIHGQDLKSDFIRSLTDQFLTNEYFSETIRYIILSFLLQLAYNPINSLYQPISKSQLLEAEIFDWKSYIYDNLNVDNSLQADTDSSEDNEDIYNEIIKSENYESINIIHDEFTNDKNILEKTIIAKSNIVFDLDIQHSWLSKNVMIEYWSSMKHPTLLSHPKNIDLCDSLYNALDLFSQPLHILTEYQVMREVLWILGSATNSFIFILKENVWSTRPDIALQDLHQQALKKYLDVVAHFASIILVLRKFGNNEDIFAPRIKTTMITKTIEAFRSAVNEKLKHFDLLIIALEKKILMQTTTNTLPSILSDLHVHFIQLNVIYEIYLDCIIPSMTDDAKNTSRICCQLLSTIFNKLVKSNQINNKLALFLLDIWLKTFDPYLQLIDALLNNGQIKDNYSEFLIMSLANTNLQDESFWKNIYQSNLSSKSVEISFLSKHSFNELIATYKSLKLVKLIDKKPTLTRSNSIQANLPQIYRDALNCEETESFCSLYTKSTNVLEGYISRKCDYISRHLVAVLKEDYQLISYFEIIQKLFLMASGITMFQFTTAIFQKIGQGQLWRDESLLNILLHEALDSLPSVDINMLEITLDNSLKPSSFIDIFNTLQLHFKISWPINIILNKHSFSIYNKIFQYLLKIKWVKFSLEGLKYQDLKQKSSKLQSTCIKNDNLNHRICIFRYKLINFINCLHSYTMTRILHHIGINFITELNNCENFDSIIVLHEQYIERLFERCLLQENVALIQQIINKVFILSISLTNVWNNITSQPASLDNILKMEMELAKCVQFLTATLFNFAQHGAFPHLEALAFALPYSNSTSSLGYQKSNIEII